MKITINDVTFTSIKSLSFSPQTDLIGQSVPINTFEADIITNQSVTIGATAELYDDLDNLWASYIVSFAEHVEAGTLRITAKSHLALLEKDILPATYYNGAGISNVLAEVFRNTGAGVGVYVYTLDSSFTGATVTGYCPEQTARDRLLWVTFTLGAYIKTFFTDKVEILPIEDTETDIPLDVTYWKPKVTYKDHVTDIRMKYYAFTQTAEPAVTDKYVDVNGVYYTYTETEMTLSNPNAPSGAPTNIVTIEGVYLVNSGNVSGILSHLAKWYFKRTEASLSAINNGDYVPGQLVNAYTDEQTMISGYIESCSFKFGLQAKADMKLTATVGVETGGLVIKYVWRTIQIGKAKYAFPVGYAYNIQNPYIDQSFNGHRYIFRPLNENCAGTVAAGEATVTENETPALDLNLSNNVLHVISVDEITTETQTKGETTYTVGVIA